MENANPPPTNNCPVLPAALRAQAIQELYELQKILAFIDSRLEIIERFLNDFANQPNETNTNDLESGDESVDTPLVSPFPHTDNDLDDDEVLNELIEYENVGMLRRERAINSFDRDDLAFECMIGFRKFNATLTLLTNEHYHTKSLQHYNGRRIRKYRKELGCRCLYVALSSDLTNKITYRKFLIKNKEEIFTDAGDGVRIILDGVASPAMENFEFFKLYLMRRSLEVLRKFHWTILEGRFNQLSHVSSPLLSKPGEY
ncbi:hypothetical protein Tco_0980049 [Tanacetum coccineum]